MIQNVDSRKVLCHTPAYLTPPDPSCGQNQI